MEVHTAKAEFASLSCDERVLATASEAVFQFRALCDEYDFVAEGRLAFAKHLNAYEAAGGDIRDALCFVWYVQAPEPPAAHEAE